MADDEVKMVKYRVTGPVFVNGVLHEPRTDGRDTFVTAREGLAGKALEALDDPADEPNDAERNDAEQAAKVAETDPAFVRARNFQFDPPGGRRATTLQGDHPVPHPVRAADLEPSNDAQPAQVNIPKDWRDTHPSKRRAIAVKLGAAANVTTSEADEVIEDELNRRSGKSAADRRRPDETGAVRQDVPFSQADDNRRGSVAPLDPAPPIPDQSTTPPTPPPKA
jgi:hypothetical protein